MSGVLVAQERINNNDSGAYLISDKMLEGMILEDVMELQASLQRLVIANPDHEVSVENNFMGIMIKWRKRNVEPEA